MNTIPALPLAAALGLVLASAAVQADTLLIERVHEKPLAAPAQGTRMQQVEARFGAPSQKLEPRGGQKRQWPVIHRWVYPEFTVYFERDRVVDVVARQAGADEVGPKPVN